jgi:hypothetical protein
MIFRFFRLVDFESVDCEVLSDFGFKIRFFDDK